MLLIAAVPAFASHKVTYGSEWTIHSAFNNQVRKIIDSPDKTFFFVHQRLYNSATNKFTVNNDGYYSNPSGAIFYYDKNNPSPGLQDLAHSARISGFDMRLVNYHPASKTLVIAYDDGGIDVISPDYKVTYFDDIKKHVMPGATTINSINFDPVNGDIWLGTKAGFAKIDAATLTVTLAPQWDEAVSDIVPVGDKVICAIGAKLYHAPKTANLSLRNSFIDTGLSVATTNNIMSLSATTFATIATSGTIYTVSWDGTKWVKTDGPASGNSAMQTNSVVNASDHTVTPTEKGFYIAYSNKAFSIERPAKDGDSATVTQIALPSGGSIYNASYDLKNFWFYTTPRTFEQKSLTKGSDGSTSWQNLTNLVPATPLTAKDSYLLYSPTQGLVVLNRHPQTITEYYDPIENTLIATYRNGQWRDVSPCYNPAYITDTNAAAKTAMNTRISQNKWVVSTPLGAAIDPLNPDVLFVGSNLEGMAAVYLDDPRKNPFIINRETSSDLNEFNADHLLENNTGWTYLVPVTPLGHDNNNVLWFYYNSCQSNINGKNLVFYAITPEGRETQLKSGDGYASPHLDLKKIVAPNTMKISWWCVGTTMRHPDNQTKIVTSRKAGNDSGLSIQVYDHKGTLDDPSDDTVTDIYKLRTPGGLNIANAISQIKENPVTGDIFISAFQNTYIINLNDPIVNGTIAARTLTYTGEDGLSSDVYPMMRSNFVDFDEYGRIWVPTQDYGLVCLSPDGKQVIATYNASNSPIGFDDIHSVGWNPDTKSLFVSANNVVCEVKVDTPVGLGNSGDSLQPFAVPQAVTSDFTGTVAIHNVPLGLTLRVRDADGKTVANLNAPVDGVAYWNLLDNEGNSVPSGSYTIEDASTHNSITPIIVPVVR